LTILALGAGLAAMEKIPKLQPPFVGPDKEWLEAFYTLEQLMESNATAHNYLQINNLLKGLAVIGWVQYGMIQGCGSI
jgi:hypothetical protein